jgi:cytochrome c-type biogenesis protein CcmH
MIFWIASLALAVALGLAVARPLIRGGGAAQSRAAFDAAVYRDQLAEIERDRARGTLSGDEAAAARLEVERRLLAAAPAGSRGDGASAPRASASPLLAAAVAVAVPGFALLMYLQLGAPGLPGQPFADRRAAGGQAAQGEGPPGGAAESMEVLTERLARRMEADPGNLEGWSLLARSYQQLERHREAVAALERAVSVSNRDPELVAALGEARIMLADGTVPPQARAEFEEVLKRDPKNPRARFYVAIAEAQGGNLQGALDRLMTMARETPAEAPYLGTLRERIGGLAQELKQDSARLLASLPQPVQPPPAQARPAQPDAGQPRPSAAAPAVSASGAQGERGPSADDVAAAQQMSPEARQQMIRGMVDGLAARLQDNPGDVEGWLRLVRAYKVLGEERKAADAVAKAAAANPAHRTHIAATARQLGIALPAQPANPATPTQVPAAQTQIAALDAAAIRTGNQAPSERLAALRQLLLLKPDDREALWQVGLAEAAQGNKLAAAELWGRLIAQFPPGSPEHQALRARLDGLR